VKRYGNLWHQIVSFENLLLAAHKAKKGKRFKQNILEFNYNLEPNIWQLKEELESQIYQPGDYSTFEIEQPKYRLISAAPYRDRVIHHALCNIISPIFERTFIGHSYANRVGYGSHRALNRCIDLTRTHQYVLQCDIKKYFPSIDLEILKSLIRRKIKCHRTLWLIDKIIDNSNPQAIVNDYFAGDDLLTPLNRRKGLPLGNLTSQFFANIYLNGLDHFVTEDLKISTYLRYVDDFAIFSNDRSQLSDIRQLIELYLVEMRLKLHQIKTQIFTTNIGVSFLGFRILSDRIRVRNINIRRGKHRIKMLKRSLEDGKISLDGYRQSVQSWIAHLNHADTWRLQQQLFIGLNLSQ
jgi:retron-type reverse transcriptase